MVMVTLAGVPLVSADWGDPIVLFFSKAKKYYCLNCRIIIFKIAGLDDLRLTNRQN
jgi:hypothetical protein